MRVSAVIPAHDRPEALELVLDALRAEPVDEVVVVDNASLTDLRARVEAHGARYLRNERNLGIAARNLGAATAGGELLLMLDDDCFPAPGSVERLRRALTGDPRVAIAGGKVVETDQATLEPLLSGEEAGSFHWFACFGQRDLTALGTPTGLPATFVAEGACLIRRDAFEAVGGFFTPYFRDLAELDLATRLLAAGWEVRYVPAPFRHLRSSEWRMAADAHLRLRARNQAWYFWRHFPWHLAVARIAAYGAFDLIDGVYRGAAKAVLGGLVDAWRERDAVGGTRHPLPRAALHRAEGARGRAHVALLRHGLRRRLGAA